MPEYPVAGTTGHVVKRFGVYLRAAVAYVAPVAEADYDTLKATFDGETDPVAIGENEDNSSLIKLTPKESARVHGGRMKTTLYDGLFEIKLLDVTMANQDYIESLIGVKIDALCEDEKTVKSTVVLDFYPEIEELDTDGKTSTILIRGKAEVAANDLAAFRDHIWHDVLTPPA